MRVGRVLSLLLAGAVMCVAVGYGVLRERESRPGAMAPREPPPIAFLDAGHESEDDDDDRAYSFRIPSGEPAALSCDAARAIVSQTRASLAYDPDPVSSRALATGAADWLDPHGLWSAASDAPVEAALVQRGAELVRELESPIDSRCAAAHAVGAILVSWVGELAKRFDHERAVVAARQANFVLAASDPVFDGAAATRTAKDLATLLGAHVGAIEHGLGPSALPFGNAARERFFPSLDADGWAKVVLAALVRSYVQLVDPHGAWAPFDEEASIYEVDLESHPPDHLWNKASRTAIGVRIDEDPRAPLQVGDVVLSLAGVPTAGLPLEQIEQLGFAATGTRATGVALVLRGGESVVRTLNISADEGSSSSLPEAVADDLVIDRALYGSGDVLVVGIHDVRDDLGDELTRALLRERESDTRPIEGIVLDLRGNGGGSTEGAIAALGVFLPGVPLFPMKRRDGTIETDRAPEPPGVDRWTGAVATLVDAETASAAEMIAGALAVYRRGPSVGAATYGKGCAQEYVDDEAHAGVLRLTTLLYALPDGSPVQRVGLTPTILLPLSPNPSPAALEREATLPHAPPSWRGPDVRERVAGTSSDGVFTWPPHGGSVGPCKDADLCRALRALGGTSGRRVSAAKHP